MPNAFLPSTVPYMSMCIGIYVYAQQFSFSVGLGVCVYVCVNGSDNFHESFPFTYIKMIKPME